MRPAELPPTPATDSLDGLTATPPETDMSELVCATGCFGRRFAPHCLQRFATARCYMAVLLAVTLLLGAVRGYLAGFAYVIGFHFGFSDAVIDWLLVGGEMVQGAVAMWLAHWGARQHQPSWLGAPVLLHAGACFIAMVPLVSHGAEHAPVTNTTSDFLCEVGRRATATGSEPCWTTLVTLILVQLTAGLSTAALYTHGIAYLDDNVDKTDSPTLLGALLGANRLGPPLGRILAYLCASLSGASAGQMVAGRQLEGPWWLGWPLLGSLLLPSALLVSMFPQRLPSMAVRERANNILSAVCGRVRIDDQPRDIDASPKIFPTFKRLVKNKVLVFTTVFLMMISAPLYAYSIYENRYLESVYYIPEPEFSGGVFKDQWVSRVTTGFLKPPIVFMTMLLTGMIIARKRPKATFLAAWNVLVALAVTAIFASYIGLTCPVSLEGFLDNGMLDLSRECNRQCNCPGATPFLPLCDRYGISSYFSPCHAGCTGIEYIDDIKLYYDCKCINYGGRGKDGACSNSSCTSKWVVYQSLGVFVSFLIGTCVVGSILLCLRSVAAQDKTTALGWVIGHIGFMHLPIKFAYKFITDHACIYWADNSYSCQLFDPKHLALAFNLFTASFFLKGAIFAALAWKYAKGMKIFMDELEDYDDLEISELREKINSRLATPYMRRRKGLRHDSNSSGAESDADNNGQNGNEGGANQIEVNETQPLRHQEANEGDPLQRREGEAEERHPLRQSEDTSDEERAQEDTPQVRHVTYV